ncbi:MAG: MliC family protein [Spirochaetaceae bacterium]|nr:MliC family protein [Spirochaetaceae bacterium]
MTKPEENSGKSGQRKIVSETQNNIVYTRITNFQGELLELIFDNAKNEALLIFKGEEANLKGQETASGTKYSNDQYLFIQWKEEIELKKDGKTIFKY